jgi:hypothetical protein
VIFKFSKQFASCLVLALSAFPLFAQDSSTSISSIPKDKVKVSEVVAIPSPFDAFLALGKISQKNPVDWDQVIQKNSLLIKAGDYKGKVAVSFALGMKVSDALVAIKAKNIDELNNSSRTIEELANKLGVDKSRLSRAEKVRSLATEGDWLGVFLELGFLQTDIISELSNEARSDERALITAAGWLQGVTHISYAISTHYSEEASSLLREPVLLAQLNKDLSRSSADVAGHPEVKEIQEILSKLEAVVKIPRDGTLTKEKVDFVLQQGKAAASIVKKTKS